MKKRSLTKYARETAAAENPLKFKFRWLRRAAAFAQYHLELHCITVPCPGADMCMKGPTGMREQGDLLLKVGEECM